MLFVSYICDCLHHYYCSCFIGESWTVCISKSVLLYLVICCRIGARYVIFDVAVAAVDDVVICVNIMLLCTLQLINTFLKGSFLQLKCCPHLFVFN